MKVINLGSGSKGNCTYVESENAKILIDCGLPLKSLLSRMAMCDINPAEISAIIITHEHGDHVKGAGAFSRKFNTKVLAHDISAQAVLNADNSVNKMNLGVFFNNDFYINDLTICNFGVPHDTLHCCGFSVYNKGKKFSIATDLGEMNGGILSNLSGSDLILLESNHDLKMLAQSEKYNQALKNRIRSSHGHLSNVDCARAVLELAKSGTHNFLLGHLSEETNLPDLAFNTTVGLLHDNGASENDFCVDIAKQEQPTKIFKI